MRMRNPASLRSKTNREGGNWVEVGKQRGQRRGARTIAKDDPQGRLESPHRYRRSKESLGNRKQICRRILSVQWSMGRWAIRGGGAKIKARYEIQGGPQARDLV